MKSKYSLLKEGGSQRCGKKKLWLVPQKLVAEKIRPRVECKQPKEWLLKQASVTSVVEFEVAEQIINFNSWCLMMGLLNI